MLQNPPETSTSPRPSPRIKALYYYGAFIFSKPPLILFNIYVTRQLHTPENYRTFLSFEGQLT